MAARLASKRLASDGVIDTSTALLPRFNSIAGLSHESFLGNTLGGIAARAGGLCIIKFGRKPSIACILGGLSNAFALIGSTLAFIIALPGVDAVIGWKDNDSAL